jgi:hypothetical protein
MWQSVRRGLENLASRRGRHPSDLMNGSGAVILLGAAGYGLYNLYACISYGMVYRHVRAPLGGSRWITYADDQ